jgi:hypothetical protein
MQMWRALALGALAVGAAGAQAVTVYGITETRQLVSWDSATPNQLLSGVFYSGLASNEQILGIDFRPANNMLYAVGTFGNIYTLNTTTGAASFVSSLTTTLNGTSFGIDFNPVADRLRITSDLDQNLRVNVDTGVTTVDGTLNPNNPNIVGSAYTNNFAGATSTTLYNVDSVTDSLMIQNPPNAGGQVLVGPLGVNVSAQTTFDIVGTNTAFMSSQLVGDTASSFFMVNLATGTTSNMGFVGSSQSNEALSIRSMAAVPEPGTMIALGLGLSALIARRRRRA